MRQTHRFLVLAGLLLACLATVWITPRVGSIELKPRDLAEVLKRIRYPRLFLAMEAGAGLALAGMTFQALFRNPLATPFTLGVTSGASLALVVGLASGLSSAWLGGMGNIVIAFAGAAAVVVLVYGIAQIRSDASTSTLLLAGVCVNFICGAGIIMVQSMLQAHDSKTIIYWLIGSVEAVSPQKQAAMKVAGVVILAGILLLSFIHRDLDLLMMGEHFAASRGVEVRRTQRLAYFGASMLTAAVASICGPIAFVGLMVPHTMRTLMGPNHRWLLPSCLLGGMILLPVCDCIARNLLGWISDRFYTELPVGVVTNVLGGLFFLVVLIRQKADRPIVA